MQAIKTGPADNSPQINANLKNSQPNPVTGNATNADMSIELFFTTLLKAVTNGKPNAKRAVGSTRICTQNAPG